MHQFDTTIKVHIVCICGTPLEQLNGEVARNMVTVKPCQVCTQAYRLEAAILKKQISRRGVMVDEKST